MGKMIGVQFHPKDKLFYCDAGDMSLQAKEYVVLDTEHGLDLARVVLPEAETGTLSQPLIKVVRRAQPEDLEKATQHSEEEALTKCKEMAAKLSPRIKPLSAHYNLDGSHLTISFGAGGRVDFRKLVRKLGRNLNTQVEMRQIGPRDEAKLLGGLGKCGYPLCCQEFLKSPPPISIRMAKEQDLALNPMRISGICGRLLCCLRYEIDEYAYLKKNMPQPGQEVSTPFGKAEVISIKPLMEMVTVKFDTETTRELPLNQLTWK